MKPQGNDLDAPRTVSHPQDPQGEAVSGKGKKKSQRDKVILKYFPSPQSLREEGVREAGRGDKGGLIGSGDSTVSTLGKD